MHVYQTVSLSMTSVVQTSPLGKARLQI